MPGFKIVFFSIQSVDAGTMEGPATDLRDAIGTEVELYTANYAEVNDDPLLYRELVEHTSAADFVYIRSMTDVHRFRKFDRYETLLRSCDATVMLLSLNLEITMQYRYLFRGGDEDFLRMRRYTLERTRNNDLGFLVLAARFCGFTDMEPSEPEVQRPNGIYHKRFDHEIPLEDYLATLREGVPTVGIIIPQTLWTFGNLDHVDALTEELERQGMNVIPAFFRLEDIGDESDPVKVLSKYFVDGERVRIDIVITLASFSHLLGSRKGNSDEDYYFRKVLNVPVLYAMTLNGDYPDYGEDLVGMGKEDMISNVI